MPQNAFKKSACLSAPASDGKPGYVHIILDEVATRGRNHVFQGIGKLFAERTGLEIRTTSVRQIGDYMEDIHRDYLKEGYPCAIITSDMTPKPPLPHPGTFIFDDVRTFTREFKDYRRHLTCHHLNKELLESEKKIFDEKHPGLRAPLIGIILNDMWGAKLPRSFAEKTIDMAMKSPEATIYLCGGWRTKEHEHTQMFRLLQSLIDERKIGDFINLENFIFTNDASYNPYVGLITKADHIIICGESTSVMSEVLFTGKTPILYPGFPYAGLMRENLVHIFGDISDGESFPTRNIEPINITSDIVDFIIKDFKAQGGLVHENTNEKGGVSPAPSNDL